MKHLGIDIGTQKVGIAISDDSGKIAFPLETVARKDAVEKIFSLIQEKKVSKVIIGESVDLQGKENAVMKDVKEMAKELKEIAEVIFESEQFSTQAARTLGKGKDEEAAAIILQSYLDRFVGKEDILFE